jgi:hypothetical protein
MIIIMEIWVVKFLGKGYKIRKKWKKWQKATNFSKGRRTAMPNSNIKSQLFMSNLIHKRLNDFFLTSKVKKAWQSIILTFN